MVLSTTLNRIRQTPERPCEEQWVPLLRAMGKTQADDEPIPYSRFLETNGLVNAVWAFRAEPDLAPHWRMFVVACLREVQDLLPDERSVAAISVYERHAKDEATDEDMAQAGADALQAVYTHAGTLSPDAQRAADTVAACAKLDAWDAAFIAANNVSSIIGANRVEAIYLATVEGV